MSDHIRHLTGRAPPSCPWRAFYSPLVDAVVNISRLGRRNLGHLALEDDPPALILDGLNVYLAARDATEAHDAEMRRKENEAQQRAALSKRYRG